MPRSKLGREASEPLQPEYRDLARGNPAASRHDARPMISVVQVGDVAHVAASIAQALDGAATVHSLPMSQGGATRGSRIKLLFAGQRLLEAIRLARLIARMRPDIVHIHWLPNALVGLFLRVPWVIHCHGSDIRNLSGWRRHAYPRLLRRATAVVYSTPDLAAAVLAYRADATYAPTPVADSPDTAQITRDVLVASRAARIKGSHIAAEALRLLVQARPNLRVAAVDGPDFDHPATRLPFTTKSDFLREVGSSRIIMGQFVLQALGISELEAMSCARPVVTSVDLTLYPEPPPVLSHSEPARIAEYVAQLLDDQELAERLGAAGRTWVRRYHSHAHVRHLLLSMYQGALGEVGVGSRTDLV